MKEILTGFFIIALCVMILSPGLVVYAFPDYETKEVIIYDSLEEDYVKDTLLINNKIIYMKLDSILKYTGYQCDYELNDTFFKLWRSGKCISIDKKKKELYFGNEIVKIEGIINFEENVWLPIDPILVYMNARCEVADGKMVIIAANTTLHEYILMFYELIESQLCTIQWEDNEKLWYYDTVVAIAAVVDVALNDKTGLFMTGQYNIDRSKSILMSVMDEMDEKSFDTAWLKNYTDTIENTKWYNQTDKYSRIELDEAIAVAKIVDFTGDVLEFLDFVERSYNIKEFNIDLVERVITDGGKYLGESFYKSKMYQAANDILTIYKRERTPMKEVVGFFFEQGSDRWATSKLLGGTGALAMVGLESFGKLSGLDKTYDDFLVAGDMYLFQKEIENGFFSAAHEAVFNPGITDREKIDFIYSSALLYIQIRNASDKVLKINAPKTREIYEKFLSVDKNMLYLDDVECMANICVVYDDIINLDSKMAEPEIAWSDTDFDYVSYFSEGLMSVVLNGKYGYINKKGKIAIPLKYDFAWDFREGLAAVRLNGKCGYIDKKGNVVIPLKYDYAEGFIEGLAVVRSDDKCGYIDKTGKEIISPKYNYAGGMFTDGLAIVGNCYPKTPFRTVFDYRYEYGYINKEGQEVIPLKYHSASGFSEGLAVVGLNGKWGYIDATGREVIPLKYDYAKGFAEGIARVDLNGRWGYIDKTGKEITPIKYTDGGDYADYSTPVHEGLALVELNGKYGYIDSKTGQEVIPLKYDSAELFYQGLACVSIGKYPNGKYGYIDKKGNVVIPLKYDFAWGFYQGLALVKLDEKYGYIDKTGKEITPIIYDDATSFIDGTATVRLNNKWGIMKFQY